MTKEASSNNNPVDNNDQRPDNDDESMDFEDINERVDALQQELEKMRTKQIQFGDSNAGVFFDALFKRDVTMKEQEGNVELIETDVDMVT